ncbi:putative RNA-directed DNA polymerase from transposon BS [Trichonephila clavipes]|nr:putative RNA-directed DNA polymerase from transposon BS [Trichonephila clavipes]
MVPWEYLWLTLRCRRVAGVSPLLSIGWWYLSSVSPKRHCCRVSVADKGCRVYPLDSRPDAVALYSGCTPGKSLVLPTFTVDKVAAHSIFLLISLPNKEISIKSPFAIHEAILGIGGEPKSIKRGVISEPDMLSTPESEILEGFSDQGVIQVRRITTKKDSNIIPTKHLILSFNSPKLPPTIKAGYLNCKIRVYIPNPLRCFKCQRFGHSQIACRGQLTCSRCASVGHSSADCSHEQKYVNCSQPHSSDSKQCPKWIAEKEIQAIKTNRNISYLEARKLVTPQLSQTYAQVTKPSIATSTTQTDENITKIKCPPLQLLKQVFLKLWGAPPGGAR